MASKLHHADLKGDPRPRGCLLKDEGKRFSVEEFMRPPFFPEHFQLVGIIKDLPQFIGREIEYREKIFFHRSSFMWDIRCSRSAAVPISLR